MVPVDGSGNHKDITGREIVQPIFPIPSLVTPLPVTSSQEESPFADATTGKGHTLKIEDIPTASQDATNTDWLSVRVDPKAVYTSSSPYMLDGLTISEQPTWIIPAIPRALRDTRKPARREVQDSEVKSYVSLIRNLVKSSGLYAIASFTGPLVSLVLVPFLTHSLSRTDYGALAVLNTAISLMTGITQFGFSIALLRAYNYDYESERDKLGALSTVVMLLSLATIPTTVAIIITAPWLANLLFQTSSLSTPVQVAALAVLLQNLSVPGFAWLRAESRAATYTSLSIVNLLVSLSANLVLVGLLHMGITGSLLATGVGYGVVMLCTLPVIVLRAGLRLDFHIARNLLSFGLPLVTNSIASWVLQLSDRYLLSRFGSLAQTATYSVAYILGGVLSVVVLSPFVLAWPTTMFAIAKRKDAPHVFQLVFRWYSIVLLFATFALSLVASGVLDLLFPPSYQSAAPVIPIVAASTMFNGVYLVFNTGVSVRRKNWFSVLFLTIAAIVNVGFNLVLIPFYGSIGAAVSTLLAYIVLAIVAYAVNQRIYHVPFEIGMFSIALLVGIILYVGSAILAQVQTTYVAWGIYSIALAIYSVYLVLHGMFLPRASKNKY